jgi:hypothetical protein
MSPRRATKDQGIVTYLTRIFFPQVFEGLKLNIVQLQLLSSHAWPNMEIGSDSKITHK